MFSPTNTQTSARQCLQRIQSKIWKTETSWKKEFKKNFKAQKAASRHLDSKKKSCIKNRVHTSMTKWLRQIKTKKLWQYNHSELGNNGNKTCDIILTFHKRWIFFDTCFLDSKTTVDISSRKWRHKETQTNVRTSHINKKAQKFPNLPFSWVHTLLEKKRTCLNARTHAHMRIHSRQTNRETDARTYICKRTQRQTGRQRKWVQHQFRNVNQAINQASKQRPVSGTHPPPCTAPPRSWRRPQTSSPAAWSWTPARCRQAPVLQGRGAASAFRERWHSVGAGQKRLLGEGGGHVSQTHSSTILQQSQP